MKRYTSDPFPPYRFVPGESPHPRRNPRGHSYGQDEPVAEPFPPEKWRDAPMYLRGIDLYNHEYFWECHEMLEAIWHAVGHETAQGQFLQGIIQVAAGNLKKSSQLACRGLERHKGITATYMGVDLAAFEKDVRDYFEGARDEPARITLAF